MQRLRSRRANRNKMNGKPLDNTLFTAYVSNTCQDGINIDRTPPIFLPPGNAVGIKRVNTALPDEEAPGIDKITTEC